MNFLKIDKNDSYANRVAKEVIGRSLVIGLTFGPLSYLAISAAYSYKEANKPQTTNSNYSIVSEYTPRATGYGAAVVQREIIKQQIAKHSETGLVEKVNGGKQ